MTDLHLPWLEASILITLLGSLWVGRVRDPNVARRSSLLFFGLALLCSIGAWVDFTLLGSPEADDCWHLLPYLTGRELLIIDELSAPLLPLVSLLFFLTAFATLSTKIRRFSFAWSLASLSITLATLCCKDPWGVITLLSLGTLPPYVELLARRKSTRVYVLHMGLFILLMCVGWKFVELDGGGKRVHALWAVLPLLLAILIRSGIAPFHCWMTDLFEKATFGTALLFITPIMGAYAALRLVLPIAPDWVLRSIALTSLFTAVYAAGMALIQTEARRFFCYTFLSHSALVLVGLEIVTPMALTGALCVWLSASLALCGFGLTLRAIEARRGQLSLTEYQGLYEHTPALAVCFLLTGLASVGFPGTWGFVGTELLIDGAVEAYPYIGVTVVIATALNGIAMVQAYFRLFTGTRYASSVPLKIGDRERFAVLTLAALILIGGFIPQSSVHSRHHAAEELLRIRQTAIDAAIPEPKVKRLADAL
ncbi:MAG: nuoM 2 [Planctomycetaceae bacterium]|nr:nuoM 2 [Planctomycetaceae bacterium]